jgi:hypothetical protein
LAPPNRGMSAAGTHIHGTHVPVEEPSTASKADVTLLNFDVRFTPESGHWTAQ